MKKKLLSVLLTVAMTTALFAGCGGTEKDVAKESTPASTQGTETEEVVVNYEDLPTLNVLFVHGYTYESDDNEIWRAVAEKVGAKIHFIGADTDKYNAMITSGDGYDIILATQGNMQTFASGGTLLALDDLVDEMGANIKETIPTFIKYSKETYSDDSNALYWLPACVAYTSTNVAGKDAGNGLLRFDLYAELGYPEIASMDEYLQVIADMQSANPTTESGEKVYGMAIPSDKLTSTFVTPFSAWAGMSTWQKTASYSWKDMSYSNVYGEDGLFWDGIEFYHKAYQMGLLDPDSFALTEADMNAKATEGRLLFVNANWQYGAMPEGQGFAAVPTKWSASDADLKTASSALSFDYGMAINSRSDNAELAMKYLDFVMSEEGANLIFNGFEGVHYTVDANGVRTLTEEGLALYKDGTAWAEAGLGTAENAHFVGLKKNALASDGKTMMLGLDSSYFEDTLTDMQKVFCEHYGVEYPAQAFVQNSEKNNLPLNSDIDGLARNFLPQPTDEISQLEAAVVSEAEGLIASLVMASDSDYEAKVEAAKAQLAKVGVTKINEFYEAHWQEAFEKAENYR